MEYTEKYHLLHSYAKDSLLGMEPKHLLWNTGKPIEKWTICGYCDYGADIQGHSTDPRYDSTKEHSPTCVFVKVVNMFAEESAKETNV